MKLNDCYPSKYLTAADLDGQDLLFTITKATLETLGQGADAEDKLVLSLKGEAKGFVCNKTNATAIAKHLGSDDTDDWIGKNITLGPREVQFGKDMVWSIRVIGRPPTRGGARQSATTAPDADTAADEEAQQQNRRSRQQEGF